MWIHCIHSTNTHYISTRCQTLFLVLKICKTDENICLHGAYDLVEIITISSWRIFSWRHLSWSSISFCSNLKHCSLGQLYQCHPAISIVAILGIPSTSRFSRALFFPESHVLLSLSLLFSFLRAYPVGASWAKAHVGNFFRFFWILKMFI